MNLLIRKLYSIKIILFLSAIGVTTTIYSLLQRKGPISTFNNEQSKITIIDLRHNNEINYLLFIGLFLITFSFVLFLIRQYFKTNSNVVERNNLTPKEKQILELIKQGKTNKEIASELFISVSTVKTHINNIFKKEKVSKRDELLKKHLNYRY